MVYVEGTKKAMRHYEKLLMQRVKWNESVATEKKTENENENDDTMTNACVKLWMVGWLNMEWRNIMGRERSSHSTSRTLL